MNIDFDTASPATELGFSIPVGPIPTDLPPISDITDAEFLSELIKQKALVNVDILTNILTTRAVNPTASVKTVVDALDANYKLSGLAAKGMVKELAAAVSIVINMPGRGTAPKTITGVVIENDEIEVQAIQALPEVVVVVEPESEPDPDHDGA